MKIFNNKLIVISKNVSMHIRPYSDDYAVNEESHEHFVYFIVIDIKLSNTIKTNSLIIIEASYVIK